MTAPLPSLNKLSLQRDTGMEASSSTIVRIPRAGRPMTDAELRARRKRAVYLAGLIENMEDEYVQRFVHWVETMEKKQQLPEITIDEPEFLVMVLTNLTDQEFRIFEDGLEYYHDLSYDAARKRWEDMPEWRKYEIIAQKRAEWMRRLDEIERRLAELQGRPYDPNFLSNDPELQQWLQDDVGMDKDSESSDS